MLSPSTQIALSENSLQLIKFWKRKGYSFPKLIDASLRQPEWVNDISNIVENPYVYRKVSVRLSISSDTYLRNAAIAFQVGLGRMINTAIEIGAVTLAKAHKRLPAEIKKIDAFIDKLTPEGLIYLKKSN